MGQYYIPTIIDDNENIQTLYSHDFNSGLKIMEHSWVGNDFVNAVYSLIHNSAKRVAWIGDYSDSPYEPAEDIYASVMPYDEFKLYYNVAWSKGGSKSANKISPKKFTKAELNIFDEKTRGMYLINHDMKEYIDLTEYIRDSGKLERSEIWRVNPLPLLTACGNDRGGGDFHGGNIGYNDVGKWAFAHIEYTYRLPAGYTKKSYLFIERQEEEGENQ